MTQISEPVAVGRASALVQHYRPKYWKLDDNGNKVPDYLWLDTPQGRFVDPASAELVSEETVYNVKTTVGIDFTFLQTYASSGLGSNGLNFIALSNDTVGETSASTTLSNEIAVNGLARTQGTYAHTAGTSTATIANTFTCATAPQAAQKAALFNLSSAGTMQHVLAFTQRSLQIGDTLAITFTITIS